MCDKNIFIMFFLDSWEELDIWDLHFEEDVFWFCWSFATSSWE